MNIVERLLELSDCIKMRTLEKVFGLLPNRIRRQEVFFLELTVSLGRTENKISECWDSFMNFLRHGSSSSFTKVSFTTGAKMERTLSASSG